MSQKNTLDRLSKCHWCQTIMHFYVGIAKGQGAAVSNRRRMERVGLGREGLTGGVCASFRFIINDVRNESDTFLHIFLDRHPRIQRLKSAICASLSGLAPPPKPIDERCPSLRCFRLSGEYPPSGPRCVVRQPWGSMCQRYAPLVVGIPTHF